MELNFKNINNLLAVLDALVNDTCEACATDYYDYDRPQIEKMEVGRWGFFAIRTHGSEFTDNIRNYDQYIRKYDQYISDFSDARYTALIIREANDSYSLYINKC